MYTLYVLLYWKHGDATNYLISISNYTLDLMKIYCTMCIIFTAHNYYQCNKWANLSRMFIFEKVTPLGPKVLPWLKLQCSFYVVCSQARIMSDFTSAFVSLVVKKYFLIVPFFYIVVRERKKKNTDSVLMGQLCKQYCNSLKESTEGFSKYLFRHHDA